MGSSISVSKCRDKYPFLDKKCPDCEKCPDCNKCESTDCPIWTQEECSNKYPVTERQEYKDLQQKFVSLQTSCVKNIASNAKCQKNLIEKQSELDQYKNETKDLLKKHILTVTELVQCRAKP